MAKRMTGHALLVRWMRKKALDVGLLRRALGVDYSRAWRLARGKRRPGIDLAATIERVSEGAVPASSWAA